jgi:hypothetical protein
MPESQSKFLIEIKIKKLAVYAVELTLPDKKTAYEWGKKWIEINKRSVEHKVVVTEVVAT